MAKVIDVQVDTSKEIEFLFVMRGGASFTVRLLDLRFVYNAGGGFYSRIQWRSNKIFDIVPGEIAAIVQVSPKPVGWESILDKEEGPMAS